MNRRRIGTRYMLHPRAIQALAVARRLFPQAKPRLTPVNFFGAYWYSLSFE